MRLEPLSRKNLVSFQKSSQVSKFGKERDLGLVFRWMLGEESVKFGVVISKRLGFSSVARHKIKRRIRHCFFLVNSLIQYPINVVCIVRNQSVIFLRFSDLIILFENFFRSILSVPFKTQISRQGDVNE
ncbi:ribonuclease P protein component [Holospora curviuscula]|uniref:Ribonuclease P n=1 Tax=Holospora curviuscula TaxID=1082868 RepID=A0A2S5R8J4_9PROT|nr:ribonuclease P protein component [Holospora curviuscula]PPE03620.1 ribonuclease P [Holospora curviuscula]